jgi:hypothetical protein
MTDDLTTREYEAEWKRYEAEQLALGRCPHSGDILHRDGEAGPHAASCDMCDCFGYNPTMVKVWPRPLRPVRWKVTRKRCTKCGKPYAGTHGSTLCNPCWAAKHPPLSIPF